MYGFMSVFGLCSVSTLFPKLESNNKRIASYWSKVAGGIKKSFDEYTPQKAKC